MTFCQATSSDLGGEVQSRTRLYCKNMIKLSPIIAIVVDHILACIDSSRNTGPSSVVVDEVVQICSDVKVVMKRRNALS